MTAAEARKKTTKYMTKPDGQLTAVIQMIEYAIGRGKIKTEIQDMSEYTKKELIKLGYKVSQLDSMGGGKSNWFYIEWMPKSKEPKQKKIK